MIKKIFLIPLIALIIIQFFPSTRNISSGTSPNDITTQFTVPTDVQNILQRACYDCHSNNTTYPWYATIQPIGWWMQHHVNEGKEELNFSEFTTYDEKRKKHKLEEIAEVVQEKEMPITSYTWQHANAKLSDSEIKTLVNWANSLKRK